MNIREEIKVLITREATTLTKVASKMVSNEGREKKLAVNSLIQKFRKKTIRFDEADEILRILGYEFKIEKIK